MSGALIILASALLQAYPAAVSGSLTCEPWPDAAPVILATVAMAALRARLETGDGSEPWAPMARAVIGGMTVSTLLTLVLVPAFSVVLANFADKRAAKKKAKRQAKLTVATDAAA